MIKLPKSNRLNRTHVFLAFRTKLDRLGARINAFLGGYPLSGMSIVIWNGVDEQYKFYGLKWDEKTVAQINWKHITHKNFLLINTKFLVSDLPNGWRSELLKEKARNWDRLYLRYRCVKCLQPLLDHLQPLWHYRFGDILSSTYFRRRMDDKSLF